LATVGSFQKLVYLFSEVFFIILSKTSKKSGTVWCWTWASNDGDWRILLRADGLQRSGIILLPSSRWESLLFYVIFINKWKYVCIHSGQFGRRSQFPNLEGRVSVNISLLARIISARVKIFTRWGESRALNVHSRGSLLLIRLREEFLSS
jgi:hypothetical protein